jgi:hypothetical protein
MVFGDLPEFTLPERRQSRWSEVRLHHRAVRLKDWIVLHGIADHLPIAHRCRPPG